MLLSGRASKGERKMRQSERYFACNVCAHDISEPFEELAVGATGNITTFSLVTSSSMR